MAEQLYCPVCANKLDQHQECWVPCEYEAAYASPEYAPLTLAQALQKRLSEKLIRLGWEKSAVEKRKREIDEIERELSYEQEP